MKLPLTWRCHVCNAERPDERISVHKNHVVRGGVSGSVSYTENVRYCNDRPGCFAAAKAFRFFKVAP